MTVKEILTKLKGLGNESVSTRNLKYGSGDDQFGVKMGDLRTIAKKIKTDHELAKDLWKTGNLEARLLATLIVVPKKLSAMELEEMVSVAKFYQLADWLNSYVVKEYPDKEALRQKWMISEGIMTGRSAWSLTAGRVARSPEGLDLTALLDRIESEMSGAAPEVQWTMNTTLAQIGICFPEHRDRALAIGEKLGIYRDYPVSKGCTSPFAPIWINEMVSRQG
ncbi:3-methyladenine DNA glycosylase AlkD [Pedobacter steynii]|uniref:3-methyladenine DNA glycosylase AlkD n=1 Tax=Pedobacter steynii TaxID=430522 RepID=A0A1G9UAM0_9SPHI|nr:DNA alkylation repair protein [Pedobacter steynii]NQX40715.1 DNA alkylation repair protein [Pedobacter steynii]SDM57010.1 3-methyladenine DNA glycosylase AlkD [Pedobacter steynii]